jgi:uncharacterized protein YwqG
MLSECALVTDGVCLGGNLEELAVDVDAYVAAAEDWCLLFQCASDPDVDLQWGDAGTLHFWIRRSDIAAGHWNRAWLLLRSE